MNLNQQPLMATIRQLEEQLREASDCAHEKLRADALLKEVFDRLHTGGVVSPDFHPELYHRIAKYLKVPLI